MAFAGCLACVVLLVVAASRLDAVAVDSRSMGQEDTLFKDSIPSSYAEESEIVQPGGELDEEDIVPSDIMLDRNAVLKEIEALTNDVTEVMVPNEASERVGSRSKRGLKPSAYPWPNGVVHYQFSAKLRKEDYWRGSYSAIIKAMNMIEDKSCVRFEPYSRCKRGNPCNGNYITFMPENNGEVNEDKWSSSVGRQLGIQSVFVTNRTEPGLLVHELLHSLGFYHEHLRPDRDDYIEIIWQNIDNETNQEYFEKYLPGNVESFNVSYDIDSIMHYSNYALSKNGKKTIVAKNDSNKVFGQRETMSPSDIEQLNLLYKCPPIDTIPVRCDDVNKRPLLYHEMVSMQFKARKWLSCDASFCRRKACYHLSKDSDCSSEPTGCQTAKFSILPAREHIPENVMNNAQVHIVNFEDLFNGSMLQCTLRQNGSCRFGSCASGEVCNNNTFTVRKQASEEDDIYRNDIISLCQGLESDSLFCLSCSLLNKQKETPCHLVRCANDLTGPGCEGILFRARVWPSNGYMQ